MDYLSVLRKTGEILNDAWRKYNGGDYVSCTSHLASLREFLNEQPELEAGGACESEKLSSGQ